MKYNKRTGRTELTNKDFQLACFYQDYVILDNSCLIHKSYIDFTDSLPASHLFSIDDQPICFNTETKKFNGYTPDKEEIKQLLDRASTAGQAVRKTKLYCKVDKYIECQLFTNLENKHTQWLDIKYSSLFKYSNGNYSQHSRDSYIMLHSAGQLIGLIMPMKSRTAIGELETLFVDLEPAKEIA